MNKMAWTQPRNVGEVNRRAGGRRRYNAARRRMADRRLIPLARQLASLDLLDELLTVRQPKPLPRHLIPTLARALGVHRSTVWRDVKRLRKRHYHWEYRGATDLVTVRLTGLVTFSYRLGGGQLREWGA